MQSPGAEEESVGESGQAVIGASCSLRVPCSGSPAGACCASDVFGFGVCRDLSNDASNCGSCGHVCSFPNATAGCSGGTCVITGCNTGYTHCGSACVDLSSDNNNCGSCGHSCGTTGTCQGGVCKCGTGAQCGSQQNCCSGTCFWEWDLNHCGGCSPPPPNPCPAFQCCPNFLGVYSCVDAQHQCPP